MPVDLSVRLGTLELRSPLMAASGCYGYGTEYAEFTNHGELGAFVTKSISLKPWKGNPPPRLSETGNGLLNSIGLANMGVEAFIEQVMPELENAGSRVIVSIACKVMEEYAEVVRRLDDIAGIDGYELNISCPNVKEGGMAFSRNPEVTEKLVRSVRDCTKRWIAAKLTPNVAQVSEGALAAEAGGADAVSLINTLVGMAVDYRSRRPLLSTVTGGYSGPPIKPVALAKVYEAVRSVKIPVVGMGGISSWEDVLEFMVVGAAAVQIGTALFADPDLPGKINESLRTFLEGEGISSIREIVGTLRTDSPDTVGAPG